MTDANDGRGSNPASEMTRMEKLARGLMSVDDIVLKINLCVCSSLLLGAAAGVKLRAHPEVRVLADRVPAAFAPLLKDFTDCAILALGAVFMLYGTDMLALMGTETAASIPISMVYPYLSIPVCGALLAFHSLVRIVVSHLAPQAQTDATLVEGVSEHL